MQVKPAKCPGKGSVHTVMHYNIKSSLTHWSYFDKYHGWQTTLMTDFHIYLISPQLKKSPFRLQLRKLKNFGSTVNSSGLTHYIHSRTL